MCVDEWFKCVFARGTFDWGESPLINNILCQHCKVLVQQIRLDIRSTPTPPRAGLDVKVDGFSVVSCSIVIVD